MGPVQLSRLRVETVEIATEVRNVDQSVNDGGGGDRAANLVEVPHEAALRDVAPLGRIDCVEMPRTLTVFRVLAVSDVHAVFVNDRRPDQLVARARPDRVLRIGIELPQLLACFGLVPAYPAVALR